MRPTDSSASSAKVTATKLIAKWRDNPVLFARQALGTKKLWSRQREILEAVATSDRVAVRSGHKVSKSRTAILIALWWMATRAEGRVVMTSSGARQVKNILWRELRGVYRAAPIPLGGKISLDPASGLKLPDGREIIGFSTKEPEKIAGYSGRDLLFIIDEASGVPEEIFEALEGNRAADGTKIIMFSNPTQVSGTFYEAFHQKKRFWRCIHISSEESPNVTGEMSIPGLAGPKWIAEKKEEWGDDSAIYAVRVKGDFPTESSNAVITLHMVTQAVANYKPDAWLETDAPLSIGVDVARFGSDESVIRGVRGLVAGPEVTLAKKDNVQVAGEVLAYVRLHRRGAWVAADGTEHKAEVPRVKVDVIGVGGGVADILRESDEVEVVDVNVSESATVTEDGRPAYSKLRDQLWFGGAEWFKAGGTYESNERLDQELIAPVYAFDLRGNRKVSSKDDMRVILHRSPDRADALLLAIYDPPPDLPGAIAFS